MTDQSSAVHPVKKYFGTDGIRGRVGVWPITPDFILKLGWAFGRVLAANKPGGKVLIGKDTRPFQPEADSVSAHAHHGRPLSLHPDDDLPHQFHR